MASDEASIRHGAAYLQWIAVAMVFMSINLVASRALAGADDTWIAMTIRGSGAVANIVFNAVFIFGLGLGAAGAAMGTVVAEALVTTCFAWGFVFGRVPLVGEFPIGVSLSRPYLDRPLTGQLLRITPPLMAQFLGRALARFPLFALLATFGPVVVAAYEVGKRVMGLLGAAGAGFSMAASSLVGQALGRGDEAGATAYSRDTATFSAAVYLVSGALIVVFAPPIARLFVEDPVALETTVPFVRVFAVSSLGYGLFRTFGGVLKAAGDNNWVMYGRLIGLYVLMLPLAYLGTITRLGVFAVYLAVIAELWSAAALTGYRVASGKWKAVSRANRPSSPTD